MQMPEDVPLAESELIYQEGRPEMNTDQDGVFTVRHTELVGQIVVPDNTVCGQRLLSFNVTTGMGKWLSKIGQFQKFRVKHMIVSYLPQCAATTQGGMLGWFNCDTDTSIVPGEGIVTLQDAYAHRGALAGTVWRGMVWHYMPDEHQQWYYVARVGVSNRFTTPAIFNMVATEAIVSGYTAGLVSVTYEFEFLEPDISGNTSGDSCYYIAYSATMTAKNPFNGMKRMEIYYQDEDVPSNQIIQTISVTNKTDAVTIGRMTLPRGFYSLDIRILGSGFNSRSPLCGMKGSYEWLVDSGGNSTYFETVSSSGNVAQVTGLFYSSGASTKQIPDDYFDIVFTGVTSLVSGRLAVQAMDRGPLFLDPLSSITKTGLDRIIEEQVRKCMKKAQPCPPDLKSSSFLNVSSATGEIDKTLAELVRLRRSRKSD